MTIIIIIINMNIIIIRKRKVQPASRFEMTLDSGAPCLPQEAIQQVFCVSRFWVPCIICHASKNTTRPKM